eukprot:s475_g21.t1
MRPQPGSGRRPLRGLHGQKQESHEAREEMQNLFPNNSAECIEYRAVELPKILPMDEKRVREAVANRKKYRDANSRYNLWIAGTATVVLGACAAVLFGEDTGPLEILVNDPTLITHVNRNAKGWQAGEVAFFKGWTIGDVQKLGGVKVSNQAGSLTECTLPDVTPPRHFDARERWPRCFEKSVYDMGNCPWRLDHRPNVLMRASDHQYLYEELPTCELCLGNESESSEGTCSDEEFAKLKPEWLPRWLYTSTWGVPCEVKQMMKQKIERPDQSLGDYGSHLTMFDVSGPAVRLLWIATAIQWPFMVMFPFFAFRFTDCNGLGNGLGLPAYHMWLWSLVFPIFAIMMIIEWRCLTYTITPVVQWLGRMETPLCSGFGWWMASQICLSAISTGDVVTQALLLSSTCRWFNCPGWNNVAAAWVDIWNNSLFSWVTAGKDLQTILIVTWGLAIMQLPLFVLAALPVRWFVGRNLNFGLCSEKDGYHVSSCWPSLDTNSEAECCDRVHCRCSKIWHADALLQWQPMATIEIPAEAVELDVSVLRITRLADRLSKDALKTLATLNRMSYVNAGLFLLQLQRAEIAFKSGDRDRCCQILTMEAVHVGSASWAIAAAGSVTNRLCISNPENAELELSAQQLLSCERKFGNGCEGGMLDMAFMHIRRPGLVSSTCFPYKANGTMPCSYCNEEEPKQLASICRLSTAESIRREIFLNGPVVAPVTLMNDFLVYRFPLCDGLCFRVAILMMSFRWRCSCSVAFLSGPSLENENPMRQPQPWMRTASSMDVCAFTGVHGRSRCSLFASLCELMAESCVAQNICCASDMLMRCL